MNNGFLYISFQQKKDNILISSQKALQYLRHPAKRNRRDIDSGLHNECCYETCVNEERREHREHDGTSAVETKLR